MTATTAGRSPSRRSPTRSPSSPSDAERWPQAAAVCDDVLRSVDPAGPAFAGVITESLAYSTLQSGPEFARWLAERGPATVPELPDPVQADRDGDTPARPVQPAAAAQRVLHRRARRAARGARGRPPRPIGRPRWCCRGNGPSFCSGGDLAEFGTFADPASAHLARTRHSPALVLDEITARLGRGCRAEVHGQVLGSGLEMAAFCGWVQAHPDAVLGLPELASA